MPNASGSSGKSEGLLQSLRNLAATATAMVRTRLELLGLELQEERVRLTRLALLGLMALFFAALGIVMLTFFIVVLFWDSHRLLTVGVLTLLYLGLGAGLALLARKEVQNRPKLFAASVAELAKDREQLLSR